MVAKKHPKRKGFTSEEITAAYELGREHCPDGMKFDSVFWTRKHGAADNTPRRPVGIYKVKGKSDVQLWLDTGKVRKERAANNPPYMRMEPTPPYPPKFRVPTDVEVPIKHPKKITPYLKVVERLLLERDLCIIMWAAEGASEGALEARAMAKKLGVKLPVRKKRKTTAAN